MRHSSCGTSGVSTETIRLLLRWVAWPMCFISIPAPLSCGTPNRRGAGAKPARRPKVILRKSRLVFMAVPLQELTDPTVLRNSMDVGSMDTGSKGNAQQSTRHRSLLCYTAARARGDSDAKNAERASVCRGRVWWAAIRTPCGGEIGSRKLGRSIQDNSAPLDYRQLRNNLSRSVK